MTCCITKAVPIYFIDDNCHINQLKNGRSCKTCLTKNTWSISHHITPLVINALGGRHRHTDTDTDTDAYTCRPMFVDETISRNQACVGSWSMPGLKI